MTFEPAFKKDVLTYTATVPNSLHTINTVTATVSDLDTDGETEPDGAATAKVSWVRTTHSRSRWPRNRNDITIEVTAEDGTTKKLYTITVTRLMTSGADDASLATLTLTDTTSSVAAEQTAVTLNPSFSRLTTTYTAEVPFATTQVTVAATPNLSGGSFSTAVDPNEQCCDAN